MPHEWKTVQQLDSFYYGTQLSDGSFVKEQQRVEQCRRCLLMRKGPFSEPGCYYYFTYLVDRQGGDEPTCLRDLPSSIDDLAQDAYKAYGDTLGWKNPEGLPMAKWEELPFAIQSALIAATQRVVKRVV